MDRDWYRTNHVAERRFGNNFWSERHLAVRHSKIKASPLIGYGALPWCGTGLEDWLESEVGEAFFGHPTRILGNSVGRRRHRFPLCDASLFHCRPQDPQHLR